MALNIDLKNAVASLLRDQAERKYGERRPDLVVGFDVSRTSRAVFGWERRYDAEVAERTVELEAKHAAALEEYESAVREWMVAEWKNLKATGMQRLRLAVSNRYLPDDLRRWAKRQLAKAEVKPNPWAVAYVVLVLRDVVDWESAHDEFSPEEDEAFANDPVAQEQAAWAYKRELEAEPYDGNPELYARRYLKAVA